MDPRETPDSLGTSDKPRIYAQLKKCWQFPLGAREAEGLVVELDVHVNPDRTVSKVNVVRRPLGSFGDIATESALRTLDHPECIPLDLPPEKYKEWKNIALEFDPTVMLQ